MDQCLCSKKDCPHKLACQHGKLHKRLENCEASLCGFGGRVECKPYISPIDNDWQDNEVKDDHK